MILDTAVERQADVEPDPAVPHVPADGTVAPRDRLRRVAAVLAIVGLAVTLYVIRSGGSGSTAAATLVVGSSEMPTSAQIEQAWGIRFTVVTLLADNGVVEIRYQVVDPGKADRIHSDGVNSLPIVHVDETNADVTPNAVMGHFGHAQTAVPGRVYSILYGNAGGRIRAGMHVSLRLNDGLHLDRVPVVT